MAELNISQLTCICLALWIATLVNDRNLTQHNIPLSDQSEHSDKESIPLPKFAQMAGPSMTFQFCNSWGYRKVFEQFASAIQEKFPDLVVRGMNYPPPPVRAYSAQGLSFLKLALIVCIAVGQNPFVWMNMTTPNVFYWAMNNKIFACMMLFFIGNAIESQLVSTGAFEISFNDVPVWSKLETGRIPSGPEMFEIIENYMRLQFPSHAATTDLPLQR